MKVQNLKCPHCSASLNRELIGNLESLFCPYCGQQFSVCYENEQITVNKNINKYVDIKYTRRTTNDAAVIRAKKENRNSLIGLVILVIICAALGYSIYYEGQKAKAAVVAAEAAGKVRVVLSQDFKDKNYKAVVAQLEVLGFENIETIDLNDAGWFSNKSDTIDTISINGDSSFNGGYFSPTNKVIITYH